MKIFKALALSLVLSFGLMQAKAQVNPVDKAIADITDSYTGIKKALQLTDGLKAEEKAKELLKDLTDFPVKSLTPEQSKIWAKYAEPLKFDSRHISEVARVPHQKEHFAGLTKNMHALLDGFKMNKAGI
jgi:hypothetical protein